MFWRAVQRLEIIDWKGVTMRTRDRLETINTKNGYITQQMAPQSYDAKLAGKGCAGRAFRSFLLSSAFLVLCSSARGYAPGWDEVGTGSATEGGISQTGMGYSPTSHITLDNNQLPIVCWNQCYSDCGDGGGGNHKAYVRRFNGFGWEEVGVGSASGAGVTTGYVQSIAGSSDGAVYMSGINTAQWIDPPQPFTVRWNGTSWSELTIVKPLDGYTNKRLFEARVVAGKGHVYLTLAQTATPNPYSFISPFMHTGWGCEFLEGEWHLLECFESHYAYEGDANLQITPTVTVGDDGRPLTGYSWSRDHGPLYAKRWTGTTWEQLGQEIADNERECVPYLVPSPRDGLFAYWRHLPLSEIQAEMAIHAKHFDGTIWNEMDGSASGGGISGTECSQPSACYVPGKGFCIVWIDHSVSSPSGGSLKGKCWENGMWSELTPGSMETNGIIGNVNVANPSIASDAFGNIFLSYVQFHNGVWDIHVLKHEGTGEVLEGIYTYEYDNVQRLGLIDSGNGIATSYRYDPSGNRIQKEVTSQLRIDSGTENPVSGGVINNATSEPVMQIAFDVSDTEDLVLNRIEFAASGTGHDVEDIASVNLWLDTNGDGRVDVGDRQIGLSTTFSSDNGIVVFSNLAELLTSGQRSNLLLTYNLSGSALPHETFDVSLQKNSKIFAMGASSLKPIYTLGAPVSGATLTISTDTTPPTDFAGIQTAIGQDRAAYLEWPAASDPSMPITYHIWQRTETFGGTVTGQANYTTEDLNFTVTGLVNGQPYHFLVRAADGAGNMSGNTEEAYAVPQAPLYVLTATAGPNGTVASEPDQFVYEAGTTVYVIPEGDTGYHFASWTGDVPAGQESDNPLVLTMDADKTVEAAFTRSLGTVNIAVTPEAASWVLTDGDGVPHSGTGSQTILDVPIGQISLALQPLSGYATPYNPPSAVLQKDSTITFSATYGPAVVFDVQPGSQRRYVGESVTFSTAVTGGIPPLHFQWKFDNGQKAVFDVGSDSPTLVISTASMANTGTYWCEVTGNMLETYGSDVVSLGVAEPLVLHGGLPGEGRNYVGEGHTMAVETTGGFNPLSYQWFKDTSPAGPNGNVWRLSPLVAGDAGTYSCTVTDDLGSSVSTNVSSLLVANRLTFQTALPPVVVGHFGEDITLTVKVTGGFDPLAYEWYKDEGESMSLLEADESTLTLQNLSAEHAGAYQVQISDANTDTLVSPTELQVTWGLPVAGIAGLVLLTLAAIVGGVRYTRRRQ